MSFSQVYAALRRKSLPQYALLGGCCFFSTLLITAYVLMLRSPTVMTVLPEGGDSRRQAMMIFVLAVIGCGVFTAYASGLFFRYKSRECGIFLVLGAKRRLLAAELLRELALLCALSCALGLALGGPLAFGVWQLFRAFVVNTGEMALSFDPIAIVYALAFAVYVLLMMLFMLLRFIRRTNIIDVVQESRSCEPVRVTPGFYGPLGVVLLVGGLLLGYLAPGMIITNLHWYPPAVVDAIFYVPAFAGLYMILLHTVVNGWRRKNRYDRIITTSMMRFQGRQTVLNLLVVTVLIAGAYFAAFYAPILSVGSYQSYDNLRTDYAFHYRADQSLPQEDEIRQLAKEHSVAITDYAEAEGCLLAVDGYSEVETEGPLGVTYDIVYKEVLLSDVFLSESAWNALTGDHLELAPGQTAAVFNDDGDCGGVMSDEISIVTNPVSGASLSVTPTSSPLCRSELFGRRVLDDGDYAALTEGLSPQWRQREVAFNVENVYDTYEFADALFNLIVDRSGPEVEVFDAWDPVAKMLREQEGEPYPYDSENLADFGLDSVSYAQRDSSAFRLYWKYMPAFRVLDKTDLIRTMSVYMMLFVFISILCFAAVGVILFTRSMTIALNNRRVYEDLRRLGAPESYLRRSIRGQISRVFFIPALVGTGMICAFYTMILFFNSGSFTPGEISGALVCGGLAVVISALLYGFYRLTLHKVCVAALK